MNMKKPSAKALPIALAALAAVGAFSVYAATNYGSEEDPLITRSYLEGVVKAELEKTFREELEAAVGDLRGSAGVFTLVTLDEGQTVTGSVGTELLPRFGRARAYAYDPDDTALVDTTGGSALSNGQELQANHLYMVTIDGNGFSAAENGVRVLVSGGYTLN